jgi:hypothetical protein
MIDPEEGEQAERVYRTFKENRDNLRKALLLLQEPLKILDLKRRFLEQGLHDANLAATDIVGTKLHSKKIGREELLDDLWAFTKPLPVPTSNQDEPTFNEENNQS